MSKQSTLVSALVLAAALAIPSKSLAISPANRDSLIQSSDLLTAFASPEAVPSEAIVKASGGVALMAADTASSSEPKAGEATETALAQSGYGKSSSSGNYLPWWRWLTLMPVMLIFLVSIFSEPADDVEYHADK
ncbi:MAG: hypothetical protein QNJ46_31975 [Leptolyngbyaceae cyanobacterium MO_188.B28]|nr:hypothetical protein [Leptolyngbyaceae cyanobacterium MO_188.B28]